LGVHLVAALPEFAVGPRYSTGKEVSAKGGLNVAMIKYTFLKKYQW
jgi:hypothetical protein